MLQEIKRIGREIVKGENLEIYLTIMVSGVLLSLSIFGPDKLDSTNQLYEAILALMLLLAIGFLGIKRSSKKILNQISPSEKGVEIVMQRNFSPDLGRFENAFSVDWMGISLHKALPLYRHKLEHCLSNGGEVRIIIINHNSEIPKQLASIGHSQCKVDLITNNIKTTISFLKLLKKNIPDYKIELRVISTQIPYRITIIDKEKRNGFMRILKFVHPKSDDKTILTIRAKNKQLFEFYKNQYELYWNSSKKVKI